MKKVYCTKCKKYRKSKTPDILHFFYITLVISIICGKCSSKRKRIFKEEYSKKKNQLKY